MMDESFVFYKSFMDAVQDLPPEVRCEAYEAIMTYSFTGEEPEMSQIARIVFRMAKPQLDANKDRRKNAKKGGEAKRDKAKAEQKKSTAEKDSAVLSIYLKWSSAQVDSAQLYWVIYSP
jgi:hypothetical protein